MRLWLLIFCLFCDFLSGYQSEYEEEDEIDVDGCFPGWRSHGDYCYRYFYHQAVPWIKAEETCQTYVAGGHLASVQSQEEMDVIYQMVLDEGTHWRHTDHYHRHNGETEHIWIGLVLWCTGQKRFKWTDGSSVNYTLAAFNIKAIPPDAMNCGAFLMGQLGKLPSWLSQKCNMDAPFVCKAPKSNVTVTIINDYEQEDLCDGWDWCQFDNKLCYKVQLTKQTWVDAQTSCQLESGNLLSVHSKTDDLFFTQTLVRNYDAGTKFWTGFNKFETMDEMLRWSDGSPLDYFPPLTVDFTQYRSSSCVYVKSASSLYSRTAFGMSTTRNDKTWDIGRCDEKLISICVKPFNTTYIQTKNEPVGGCNPGFVRYGNRCYKVFGAINGAERTNYYNAHKKCRETNANLVSIKDIYENYFVLSLLNHGQNQSWIGLISDDGSLKWIDQTGIAFTSIDANTLSLHGWELDSMKSESTYPRYTTLVRNDRCFVMTIDKWPGRWEPIQTNKPNIADEIKRKKRQDYYQQPMRYGMPFVGELCEKENLSFVCEQSISAAIKSDKDELACDFGANYSSAYKYGNGCYAFVSSQQSWLSAEKLCQESKGSLASLTNVYEFGFVASMARYLKIKEFWIGLSDQKNLGRYVWSDDWPVHFTSWAPNQPTKNSLTQCVKMKLNDDVAGEWSSTECENSLPYVCKKTTDPKPKPNAIEGRCEPGWHEGSTLCYKIHTDIIKRTEGIVRCLREYHGATLAAFPTQDDVDSIVRNGEIMNSKRRFFIGLLQKTHGGFEWLNNEPVSFVNWAPNELQRQFLWTFRSTEVCVEMDQKGLWYAVSCYENRNFICSQPKQKLANVTAVPATTPIATASVPISKPIKPNSEITLHPPMTRPVKNPEPPIISTSTVKSTKDHVNESLKVENSLAPNKFQLKPAKPASTNVGAAIGITICVLFFILLIIFAVIFMYRRHRVGGGVFNWFRRSSAQMRFEVLNENNEM